LSSKSDVLVVFVQARSEEVLSSLAPCLVCVQQVHAVVVGFAPLLVQIRATLHEFAVQRVQERVWLLAPVGDLDFEVGGELLLVALELLGFLLKLRIGIN